MQEQNEMTLCLLAYDKAEFQPLAYVIHLSSQAASETGCLPRAPLLSNGSSRLRGSPQLLLLPSLHTRMVYIMVGKDSGSGDGQYQTICK